MSDNIIIKDGFVYGGWREPKNIWTHLKDSIHDDTTAQKVGMRGGTIPGTIHLSLFPPLLLKTFGDRWFEKGSISMYYTYATTDRENVRAVIALPPEDIDDTQVDARVEMRDGRIVAKGTVSIGDPSEPSYLQTVDLKNSDPKELRILADFKVGYEIQPKEVLVSQEEVEKGLKAITDHLEYYKGDSPWGCGILSPTAINQIMQFKSETLSSKEIKGVPFYGATEIQIINGPVKVDVPYKVNGKIICVGVSPKTEYFWYDSILEEKETSNQIAKMRHMNRFMKAYSPLYQSI
ncbi:MAG: hypothetical protein ACFFA0_13005 [Promethearchaeota archaeon]